MVVFILLDWRDWRELDEMDETVASRVKQMRSNVLDARFRLDMYAQSSWVKARRG